MPITTNERYKKFLARQIVEPINKEEFKALLGTIESRHLREARALCILLWTTGARPNEAVRLHRDNLSRKDSSLWIDLPGSKGSLARTIELPVKNDLVAELWEYVSLIFPGLLLFPHFVSAKHRPRIQKKNRKGEIKYYYGANGADSANCTGYTIYNTTLRYHFKKWFNLPPYIFRHNRLTIAAEKLTLNQLKQLKGAKTEASVWPYISLTKKEAQTIGRELVK